MNLIDVLLLIILTLGAFGGRRQGTAKQLCRLIGMTAGIFLAAYLYNLLSFLTENSTIKIIVLAAILAAATFLTYDIFSVLGNFIQKNTVVKRFVGSLPDKIGSALVTTSACFVLFWFGTIFISGVLPQSLRVLINQSTILATVSKNYQPPQLISNVGKLLQPFSSPDVFVASEPDFDINSLKITQEYDQLDTSTKNATPSVIKVNAWGCGGATAGSGFVVDSNLAVTNAHVVAGADRLSIQNGGNTYGAAVVLFNPQLDLAILRTESALPSAPLVISTASIASGAIGATLGYPGGGGFVASDVIVLKQLSAEGYDIYNQQKTTRQIYAVRSTIVPGDSGGPLINAQGSVAGVIIGHSTTNDRIGYAITANQIVDSIKAAHGSNAVGTGPCAGA